MFNIFKKSLGVCEKCKQLEQENLTLQQRVKQLEGKQVALIIERDFWVEQGRNLQNNLQTWQRMYSGMYDQLGNGVVTDQDIADNLAVASAQLKQPLTTVEAIRSLTACMDAATQGKYTSVFDNAVEKIVLNNQSRLENKDE